MTEKRTKPSERLDASNLNKIKKLALTQTFGENVTVTASHIEENINKLYSTQDLTQDKDHLWGIMAISLSLGDVAHSEYISTTFLCTEKINTLLKLLDASEDEWFEFYTQKALATMFQSDPVCQKLYNQIPTQHDYYEGLMLNRLLLTEQQHSHKLMTQLKPEHSYFDITPFQDFFQRFQNKIEGKSQKMQGFPDEVDSGNCFYRPPVHFTTNPNELIHINDAVGVVLNQMKKHGFSINPTKLQEFHERLVNFDIIDENKMNLEAFHYCLLCAEFPFWDFLVYKDTEKDKNDGQKKVFICMVTESECIHPNKVWADTICKKYNTTYSVYKNYFNSIVDDKIIIVCQALGIKLSAKQKDALSKLQHCS